MNTVFKNLSRVALYSLFMVTIVTAHINQSTDVVELDIFPALQTNTIPESTLVELIEQELLSALQTKAAPEIIIPQLVEFSILGSGACLPMPNRRYPANLLQVDNQRFLVDSGPGTLHTLTLFGLDLDDLNGAFYTHFHHDHIGDLISIITWFQVKAWTASILNQIYTPQAFTIYGPVGISQYIQNILSLTPDRTIPSNIFIVEVKPNDRINFTSFVAQVGKVVHTPESVGYRFDFANGKSLAITGDTSFSAETTKLIKNVDVAVLECSYDDAMYEQTKPFVNHLGPTAAGELAQAAEVKNTLVLTHLYPSADAVDTTALASKAFKGNVVTAEDGMILSLSSADYFSTDLVE